MTDETGSRRLPPGYTTLGGHPGSGDGATMPPPPDDLSGSPPPADPVAAIRDAIATKGPLTGGIIWPPGYSVPAQQGETLAPISAIRAQALQAAVATFAAVPGRGHAGSPEQVVLDWAERYRAWLEAEELAERLPIDPHAFCDQQGPFRPGNMLAPCLLVIGPQTICGRRRDDPVHTEAP